MRRESLDWKGPVNLAGPIFSNLPVCFVRNSDPIQFRHSGVMSGESHSVDDDLENPGLAMLGKVDSQLIANIKELLPTLRVSQRRYRQTELEWSKECDDIQNYFDIYLKPNSSVLKNKSYRYRRLAYYHQFLGPVETFTPHQLRGQHTVMIVIRRGPGFSLLSRKKHESDEGNVKESDTIALPQEEGAAVLFRSDRPRKNDIIEDEGMMFIILQY
ncbi:MAG: hypothetical protein M1834_000941 [Cirrosporium novae-zelandiae]|nr:MAG: hypothetical protein M1834_000941 [Cirrosporium novae-zelandiae]